MSLTEISLKVNALAEAWEEFKSINDKKIQEIEKKGDASFLTKEQLSRLNTEIEKNKQQIEAVSACLSHPEFNTEHNSSIDMELELKSLKQFMKTGIIPDFYRKSATDIALYDGTMLLSHAIQKLITSPKNKFCMRALCAEMYTSKPSIEFLSLKSQPSANWTESQQQPYSSNGEKWAFTKTTIHTHECWTQPQVTQSMLEDAFFNVERWLIETIAEKFSETEEMAFTLGSGTGQPKGLLHDVSATKKQGNVSFEALMELYYSLPPQYATNGSFMASGQTISSLRTLKDSSGRYIMCPISIREQLYKETLLGIPVYRNEHFTNQSIITSLGQDIILFADFRKAYIIATQRSVKIIRDPFTSKGSVSFFATKRVGGTVIDQNAVQAISFNGK